MSTDSDTLEIRDLDHFVQLLSRWHTSRVSVVKHLLEVPESMEVSIDDSEPVKLAGDFRKGFHLGISLALNELGKLPFVAELEDAPTAVKH